MLRAKLMQPHALWETLQKRQAQGERVVFTNGCFDLLHAGHVLYLEEARQLGDILVVGLNSDASVQRLKGPSRPINAELERALVLAALESVSYVCIFSEDTPYSLIKLLSPNILVKGGDWAAEEIVGSELVLSSGGTVKSLSFSDGLSSSKMIHKIKGYRQ